MELGDILAALRRHKLMVCASVALAAMVALLSLYSPSGAPRAKPLYTSQTRVLVDSADFGIGRVELAQSEQALTGGGFDDRAKTVAFFVDSAFVLDLLPAPLVESTKEILTTPLEETPVVQIEVTADSPKRAQEMARRLPEAMQRYILRRQEKAGTPSRQRVEITLVQPATDPEPAPSKAKALALLAFLLVLSAGLLATIARDNYARTRSRAPEPEEREQPEQPDRLIIEDEVERLK